MPVINSQIAETVDITTNGQHNVSQYTTANVAVDPSIESLNISATTSEQTITAPTGTDGYSPITVAPVTAAIDANITAENIKKNVTILGVTGSYEGGGGASTKYGINMLGWIGDINTSGKIRTNQAVGTLSIPGLTGIDKFVLSGRFRGSSGLVGTVDLSGVQYVEESGLWNTFVNTGITGLDLSSVSGSGIGEHGCEGMCANCSSLASVSIGGNDTSSFITNYSFEVAPFGFKQAFLNTAITTLVMNVDTLQCSGDHPDNLEHFTLMCSGCSNLTDVYFPCLYGDMFAYSASEMESFDYFVENAFYNMLYNCSNVTVHLRGDFVDGVIQVAQEMGWEISSEQDITDIFLRVLGGTDTVIEYDIGTHIVGFGGMDYNGFYTTLYRDSDSDTGGVFAWSGEIYNLATNTNIPATAYTYSEQPEVGDIAYKDTSMSDQFMEIEYLEYN